MNEIRRSGNYLMTDGIISFVAGIILLFLTGISQSLAVILFAAYAALYGVSQLVAARGERSPENNPNSLRAIGIFSIIAAVIILFFMTAALPIVIFLIAAHAIIVGAAELAAAYMYREEVRGDGWWIGVGIIRLLFGLFLLFNLGMSLPGLILTIAWYAIIIGPVLAIFGYETRGKEAGYRRHPAH
jgi:uncharacterized membrane protein HdeD (DUF308 family)